MKKGRQYNPSPKMKSYPTYYKEQLFRSRLEAKWAAFFDYLHWPYIYEPIDLEKYIPDFILQFDSPLLVEVKPEVLFKDLEKHTDKILKSGWDKEVLVVGANLFKPSRWDARFFSTIGLLGEKFGANYCFNEGIIFRCNLCNRISIFHSVHSFRCRVNNCHQGDSHIEDFYMARVLWGVAHEKTQWYPKSSDKKLNTP